ETGGYESGRNGSRGKTDQSGKNLGRRGGRRAPATAARGQDRAQCGDNQQERGMAVAIAPTDRCIAVTRHCCLPPRGFVLLHAALYMRSILLPHSRQDKSLKPYGM